MMRRGLFFLLVFACVVVLGGCATGRKQNDLEAQGLKNQVSLLEAQIQSKDEEINSLRESLAKQQSQEAETKAVEINKKRVIGEVKSHPNAKQIQIALANAGYNPGAIDGRMGRQTRDAIKAFQRANNLPADGHVGKKTWAALKEYLYKKVK